ncbi:MAG: class I SAM-dependent methyltransferase [Desulfobacterales bacterium]|nr:class I SAM-dependent methyltransferase [Desulfobacterales bacterium]
MSREIDAVRARYDRRRQLPESSLYSPLNPSHYLCIQEKERALIRWIKTCGLAPVENRNVLEIGCGGGGNLLQFLKLGFRPENLVGNELLEERSKKAREMMPASTRIISGDALTIDLPEQSFDIVFQSTVFTSILDSEFQSKLAGRMWDLAKPGGGVLWYDFIYNNPNNPDVRGIGIRRIRELFPNGQISKWKLTLAPPISRFVTRIHPGLYSVFNALTFLRTHVLCWVQKPSN